MSIYARLVLIGLVLLALVAGYWRLVTYHERVGYDRAKAEYAAAAELQRESNRMRSRTVETTYAAKAVQQDRFLETTTTEIRHAAPQLADVALGDRAVGMLNDAIACARESGPTACHDDDAVPGTEAPAAESTGR